MAGYPAAGTGPDATGGSEPQRDVLRGPQLPDPASDVMGGPGPQDDVLRGPQLPDPASDVMGGPRTS